MSSPLWSESAFGVVHKSWTKMKPKLGRASQMARDTDDIAQRMNVNYAQWRYKSGYKSTERAQLDRGAKSWDKSDSPMASYNAESNRKQMAELPAQGKKYKDAANAAALGHTNAVRRKGRQLP